MSKMWEVDPETRSKLLEIQKENGNNQCVDCNAPSPQWASPKFGIFMCLNCSGIHRGLGVHISFVRSITMDAFKAIELAKMKEGGNKPWRQFFDAHDTNKKEGRTFEGSTIQQRYDCEVGDEWREKLSSTIEGRDFDPANVAKRNKKPTNAPAATNASQTGSRTGTPLGRTRAAEVQNQSSRSSSPSNAGRPAIGTGSLGSKKVQNEAYFARMGAENASRSDALPPNQGGKFTGFGSDPLPQRDDSGGVPGIDDFQKDPVAALTKGFGWLSSTVGKGAQTGYEGWVKPGMQKLAEADLATQARQTALTIGQTANTTFTRFVEGDASTHPSNSGTAHRGGSRSAHAAADPEKKDFWDSFGDDGDNDFAPQQRQQQKRAPAPEKQDFWESFGAAPKGPSTDKADFWDSFGGDGTAQQQKQAAPAKKSTVGTTAMRKPGGGASGGTAEKKEEWGEW